MITRGPDNYTCITYKKKLEILEKCYARTTTILNTAETLERKTLCIASTILAHLINRIHRWCSVDTGKL